MLVDVVTNSGEHIASRATDGPIPSKGHLILKEGSRYVVGDVVWIMDEPTYGKHRVKIYVDQVQNE